MISRPCLKWAAQFALFLLFASPTVSSAQTNDRSVLLPSTQKYKDTGLHDARGRSGNAVVAARALLGKDRITTIEITTSGDVDNPQPAPGSISKVQEKVFNDSDKLLFTTNYNVPGSLGYVIQKSDSLARHQTFQIQANVDGIDAGTDVVTVHETVKLRPDLIVERLLVPRRTVQNHTVVFHAVVSELNGDVGARADCVLYADSGGGFVAVDTAPSIWVDAGGTVSCDLTYGFPLVGTIQIKVQVENVNPGDYDGANNFQLVNMEVSSGMPLGGIASVSYEQRNKHFLVDSFFGNTLTMHGEDSDTRNHATVEVRGQTNEPAADFPYTLSAREANAGSWVFSKALVLGRSSRTTWSEIGWDYVESCGNTYDDSSNLTVYLCNKIATSLLTGNSIYWLDLDYFRKPGDVTFHSEGFCTTFDSYYHCQNTYSYYSWNYTTSSVWDGFAPVNLNTNYEVNLHLTSDSGASFEATATVPVDQSSTVKYGYPYECWTTSNGHSCQESLDTIMTFSGSLAF